MFKIKSSSKSHYAFWKKNFKKHTNLKEALKHLSPSIWLCFISFFFSYNLVFIVSKKQKNINKLINSIKQKIKNQFKGSENILITRERHRKNLEECLVNLKKFNTKKKVGDFDKAAEDLRLATRSLGKITGKVDVEDILDSIFNDFCIGK